MTEPAPAQAKQTQGRRKPNNSSRRPNRKNYASENDAAKADPNFQPDFAQRRNHNRSNGPTTPQKSQKNAAAIKSPANAPQNASGKTNNRNNRNQQATNTATPGQAKSGRRTPPQTAGPKSVGHSASVTTSAAFAGATFHASPAPSSLPLPSFFTKTNSPGTPSARPASGLSQQPSPPASDTELPSATTTIRTNGPPASGRNPLFPVNGASIPPPRDESPLDILFRADRAEKERNRRASSANLYGAPVGPFSPPLQTQHMADNTNSNTFPRDGPQQFHLQQQQQQTTRRPGPTLRTSSSGISAAELDGTPGQPMGPAFATPFHDRIRAARPTEAKGPSAAGAPAGFRDLADLSAPSPFARGPNSQQPPAPGTDDRSEALKRFLFSKTGAVASPSSTNSQASASTTPTRYPGPPSGAPQPGPYGGSPYQDMYSTSAAPGTPGYQGYSNNQGQATPNRSNGNNVGPSHISAMEDSLRQILKLDSPFGNGASSPGINRQS
ncbi:hypothetical protein SEUCBS140593_005273 [Sporothrix eucalyptigena]|uniref:Proteophosphoglycan 5 n=1 Tax=Sporothrix eucalyptigena TaxID=1812306 RepID=A0ABP0BVW3_9PEZI